MVDVLQWNKIVNVAASSVVHICFAAHQFYPVTGLGELIRHDMIVHR